MHLHYYLARINFQFYNFVSMLSSADLILMSSKNISVANIPITSNNFFPASSHQSFQTIFPDNSDANNYSEIGEQYINTMATVEATILLLPKIIYPLILFITSHHHEHNRTTFHRMVKFTKLKINEC